MLFPPLVAKENPKGVICDSATRPADIIIDDFENGKALCIDLTVANVDCKSHASWTIKYACGEDALGLAKKAAVLKHKKHDANCERNGYLFVPFVMELYRTLLNYKLCYQVNMLPSQWMNEP